MRIDFGFSGDGAEEILRVFINLKSMNQTIDRINAITNDIVDPEKKLGDTLLKVQVLAHKLQSQKLKEWVDAELNGYQNKKVPAYRVIPTVVHGNLIQQDWGGISRRTNTPLPVRYLEKPFCDDLLKTSMVDSVSEIEAMVAKDQDFYVDIDIYVNILFDKILGNDWHVDRAWRFISHHQIEGLLSSIKSILLTYMLEIADEIGEQDAFDIQASKPKFDKIFDKTMGNVTGENVNIFHGNGNVQGLNTGDKANLNVAKGEHIEQSITVHQEDIQGKFQQLKELVKESKEIEPAVKAQILECAEEVEENVKAKRKTNFSFEKLIDLTSKFVALVPKVIEIGTLIHAHIPPHLLPGGQ